MIRNGKKCLKIVKSSSGYLEVDDQNFWMKKGSRRECVPAYGWTMADLVSAVSAHVSNREVNGPSQEITSIQGGMGLEPRSLTPPKC